MLSPSDLYFETRGVRLRYRDEGRGPTLILVHGWTLDLEQWNAQAAALRGEFRVVRIDRRGFGLSSGVPSIAADAADLLVLCNHLGLESVALLGMSQGARVVLQFAAAHPMMTSCVILDGPPHVAVGSDAVAVSDVPYQHYRQVAQAHGLAAFRREWSEHGLVRLNTTDPSARALLTRMIEGYAGRDLLETTSPDQGPEKIRSMDRPALLVNGQFDLDSRKTYAAELASRLPHVERAEIPGAGHLCNLDNPIAYNEAVGNFLHRHAIPSNTH